MTWQISVIVHLILKTISATFGLFLIGQSEESSDLKNVTNLKVNITILLISQPVDFPPNILHRQFEYW